MFESFASDAQSYSGYRAPSSVEFSGAEAWSGIPDLVVDPSGGVWIAGGLSVARPPQVWRRVSPRGVEATVRFPLGFELMHIGRRFFYGRATAADESVQVWAIERARPG